jgi:NAD(P)H-hydrate epimerase
MIPCAAAEYLGRVDVLGHIGLTVAPQSRQECYWTAEEDFADYPPNRRPLSHKGTYGHLTILAGSAGYHGAAVLAARGAMRARPGLVSVVTQPGVFLQIGSQLASAMVHRYKSKQSPPDKTTAILAGPGLAAVNIPADYRDWVQRLWRESFLAMVADANALDWLPSRAVGSNPARILTPHPGEAARMLHIKPEAVEADRVGALRQLSLLYGNAWVALKGHQTMVGRHVGPIYINNTGNPGLAQGGTGDVLAGYIGGLRAQPELQTDACLATR